MKMKAKCELFVSAIIFIGITVCLFIYPPKMLAGEAQDQYHKGKIEKISPDIEDIDSNQTQPDLRQMNKPRPKPKQEPPLQPVPLLNPCSKCQLRCINFKGESFASYCHGLCVRDGYCEE
jgi:hypothetical protein